MFTRLVAITALLTALATLALLIVCMEATGNWLHETDTRLDEIEARGRPGPGRRSEGREQT